MFYKVCLGLAVGIVTLSLIGSFSSASSLTLRQQNYVSPVAQSRLRNVYIVPTPYGRGYSAGTTGTTNSGSSRSSYDGYRGGGPGAGK